MLLEINERFNGWLNDLRQRPLSEDKIAKVKTLARELAEGVMEEFWTTLVLSVSHSIFLIDDAGNTTPTLPNVSSLRRQEMTTEDTRQILQLSPVSSEWECAARYFALRWDFVWPPIDHLQSLGYIDKNFRLTKASFDLINQTIPAKIFVSYHRPESSAIGLLIVARFKAQGLQPFIDMELIPGEEWHAGLERRIASGDYDALILLLAPETLNSLYVQKEIIWALDAGIEIIPIWHNSFKFKSGEWRGKIPDVIDEYLSRTQAIRVLEESASGYNTAIVELLNRFGITPD